MNWGNPSCDPLMSGYQFLPIYTYFGMDLSLADPWQQTKFEEKRKQQSKSLNPIADEFKQNVEQDLSLKQEDFHKRLDEADQLRRYGPAIEDTNELPYLVRKCLLRSLRNQKS